MLVLIPAYEPDAKLLALLDHLAAQGDDLAVIIVDDGSGPDYRTVFEAAAARGATVIGHPENQGKGAALKRGFAYAAENFPTQVVVCADCDGQHTYADILRVGREASRHRRAMVLGARDFAGEVPAKSRFGNSLTRFLYGLVTHAPVQDTQTGLRAYPPDLLPWLCSVGGDRFDYELRLLLEANEAGVAIVEIPTATIYLDGNASTHFRPIVDSARVYAPLLRFAVSSLGAAAVDVVVLVVLMALSSNLLFSVVGARTVSSLTNYLANRSLVFRDGRTSPIRASAPRYFVLVAAILAANYGLMRLLVTDFGIALLAAKLLTESVLFALSYQAQRTWIFPRRRGAGSRTGPERTVAGSVLRSPLAHPRSS